MSTPLLTTQPQLLPLANWILRPRITVERLASAVPLKPSCISDHICHSHKLQREHELVHGLHFRQDFENHVRDTGNSEMSSNRQIGLGEYGCLNT